MKVLGLDPSLREFGFAVFDEMVGEAPVVRGRIRTEPAEFEDFIDRYVWIREEMRKLIREHQPDRIGIEHPVTGSSQSEALYALFYQLLEVIKLEKKDVVLVSPSQLKTWARTKIKRPPTWKMEKVDMIEAAMKLANDSGKKWHDGEADAFLIARFSHRFWQHLDGVLVVKDLTSNEKHAFLERSWFTKGKNAGKMKYAGIVHEEGEKFYQWSKSAGLKGKKEDQNGKEKYKGKGKGKRRNTKSNDTIKNSDGGGSSSEGLQRREGVD